HRVDMILGCHNLPGYPEGKLLFKRGTFALASEGLILSFTGKQSHAAYPEQGRNPAFAVAAVIGALPDIVKSFEGSHAAATVISVHVGERNFGISPEKGELCLTLRAAADDVLQNLERSVLELAEKLAGCSGIVLSVGRQDVFPATVNDPDLTERIAKNMKNRGYDCAWLQEPMRWSEDFGYFSRWTKTVYFGFGTGKNCPGLHTEQYVFPEDLPDKGVNVWCSIIEDGIDGKK
ncbi:MAG: M20/M25/M40 family metallo-hydrolase, partial [Eubacterium sp.]|nr:M20/M25/M40 family metallo-hydrolase [Eubacterium sp.]